jgi:hypothetical protein
MLLSITYGKISRYNYTCNFKSVCSYSVFWISRCPHTDQILPKFFRATNDVSGAPIYRYVMPRRVLAIGGSCCFHLVEQYLVDRGYRFFRKAKAELTPHTASQPLRLQISYRIIYVRQGMSFCIYVTQYNIWDSDSSVAEDLNLMGGDVWQIVLPSFLCN